MQQAQAVPHAPDLRYHLAHAVAEWRAALALLQEWTAPE
jgi:predicted nicotinamide N-methyase